MKKVFSLFLTAVLLCSVLFVFPTSTEAAHYNSYTTKASLPNSSSCGSMQGLAMGKTYIYNIKRDDNDANCIIYKVARESGNKLLLTNSSTGGSTIAGLGHANDACLVEIGGVEYMFVTTMEATSTNLWKLKLSGDYYSVAAKYAVKYNGSAKGMAGVDVMSFDGSTINFLFKSGDTFYKGSLSATAATGTTITTSKAFAISRTGVNVNGTSTNYSGWTNQGYGYYKGMLFVPVTSGASSAIIVYEGADTATSSTTLKAKSDLSFKITSSDYSALFEMESVAIGPDGKLYFNTNRRKSSSDTNHDGVHYINNFNISAYETGTPVISAASTVNTGASTFVSWAACANATKYNYTATFKSASGASSTLTSATGTTSKSFTIPAVSEAGTITVKVTAVGSLGSVSATKTISVVNPIPTDITVASSSTGLSKSTLADSCYRGFEKTTTAASALSMFAEDSSYLQIRDSAGTAVEGTAKICTGYTVNIINGSSVTKSYTLVVEGDVNGDGTITSSDTLAQSSHLQAKATLDGAYLTAADFDANGSVTSSDYLSLVKEFANGN